MGALALRKRIITAKTFRLCSSALRKKIQLFSARLPPFHSVWCCAPLAVIHFMQCSRHNSHMQKNWHRIGARSTANPALVYIQLQFNKVSFSYSAPSQNTHTAYRSKQFLSNLHIHRLNRLAHCSKLGGRRRGESAEPAERTE